LLLQYLTQAASDVVELAACHMVGLEIEPPLVGVVRARLYRWRPGSQLPAHLRGVDPDNFRIDFQP
jgi:hypothetical protein